MGAPSWIWSPILGARWSTVLTMAAILVVVGWRTRSPLRALVVAMAWLCGYEILYEATGSLLHRWSLTTLMWTTSGTAGWLVAYWLWGMRPPPALMATFTASWFIWILAGFNSNWSSFPLGQPGADAVWSWTDEALNVTTKTLLALALLASQQEHLHGRLDQVEGLWRRIHGGVQNHGMRAGSHASDEKPA